MNRRRIVERKTMEYQITEGEYQLLWQLRDIGSKMGSKPYACIVTVIDDYFHIYEGVPRGRFPNFTQTVVDNLDNEDDVAL